MTVVVPILLVLLMATNPVGYIRRRRRERRALYVPIDWVVLNDVRADAIRAAVAAWTTNAPQVTAAMERTATAFAAATPTMRAFGKHLERLQQDLDARARRSEWR